MPNKSSFPIIRSKLYRPQIAKDVIERRRLVDHALASEGNAVTLVSAQAGYGKSTLVSQWLNASGRKNAWLSLDPADSDLAHFLAYFVAAIQTIFPNSCQETSECLLAPSLPSPTELAGTLGNEIDHADSSFFLVLDDYHNLGDSEVHDFLECILRHPPRLMHLVIVTRRDPPLSLQSFRAGGVLTEFRMQDLSFTESESNEFIARSLGDQISSKSVERLHRVTEGWPVGLRLAILAAPEAVAIDSLSKQMPGDIREVREYLLAEILAQQPPAIKYALLRTSFLDRFNAGLCEAVAESTAGSAEKHTERIAGDDFLLHIQDAGLLGIALDDDQEWFRYHHLFQSMLQGQASHELGEDGILSIHRKAAQWLEDNGFLEEAIHHALAGDGPAAAGGLIVRHRDEILNLERMLRIERWLGLLPPELIKNSPDILIIKARIHQARGLRDEAWAILDEIDVLLISQELGVAEKTQLKGSVEALRCYQHYSNSDGASAVRSATYAIEHLPEQRFAERGFAMTLLGGSLQMAGQVDLAKRTIYEAMSAPLPDTEDSKTLRIRLLISLCFIHWMNADLQGLKTATTELEGSFGKLALEETQDIWRFFQATYLYHMNDLSGSGQILKNITQQTAIGNIEYFLQSIYVSSLVHHEQGRHTDSRTVAQFALDFALQNNNKPLVLLSESFIAELAIRQGRLSEAKEWGQNFDVGPFEPMYQFYSPLMTYAKYLLLDDSEESRGHAREFLDGFSVYLDGIHNKRFQIEVLALRAMLNEAAGNHEAAVRDLATSIRMALPGRFIRLFLDLGPRFAGLLNSLDVDEEGLIYVGEILAGFRNRSGADDSRPRSTVVATQIEQSGVDPLSKRELQILTLLAGRLSNKEIAEELYISVVTVKRHAANIYQKLGVHDRKKAVAKAAGLGLIE